MADERGGEERAAEGRREIRRVAHEILPPLMARLGHSSLGEIEVHGEGWRVRLRRDPALTESSGEAGRRRPEGGARRSPRPGGAAGLPGTAPVQAAPAGAGNGAGSGLKPVGPGREPATERAQVADPALVSSPAVGYYLPRDGVGPGRTVRSGDLLGHVDVLGVRQDVVADGDGVVVELLVEPGEAVEYGQELLRLDRGERASLR